MDKYLIKNKKKITEIVELMISKKVEIKVRIIGQEALFTSQFIHLAHAPGKTKASDSSEKGFAVILKKLTPEEGNSLIQSFPDISIECTVAGKSLRFASRYLGISSNYPYFGIMADLPEFIELEDMRREERITPEMPDFISVEFKLGKTPEKKQVYQLDVIDCSSHGLGLLVTKKDFELLRMLNPGDRIKGMTFYATWVKITVNATVKHKTEIKDGDHKGQYMIGVESSDIIENCKPPLKKGQ